MNVSETVRQLISSKNEAIGIAIDELTKYLSENCPGDGCDATYHWRGCPNEGSTKQLIHKLKLEQEQK